MDEQLLDLCLSPPVSANQILRSVHVANLPLVRDSVRKLLWPLSKQTQWMKNMEIRIPWLLFWTLVIVFVVVQTHRSCQTISVCMTVHRLPPLPRLETLKQIGYPEPVDYFLLHISLGLARILHRLTVVVPDAIWPPSVEPFYLLHQLFGCRYSPISLLVWRSIYVLARWSFWSILNNECLFLPNHWNCVPQPDVMSLESVIF